MGFAHQRKIIAQGLQACNVRPRELVLVSVLGVFGTLFRVVSVTLFLPLVYAFFSDASSPRGKLSILFEALPQEEVSLAYIMSGAILLAGSSAAILSYLTNYYESRLSLHAQTALNRKVFRRFLSYGQAYSDHTGPKAQIKQLRNIPARMARRLKVLSKYLRAALELLIYSSALLVISWPAALACYFILAGYYLVFTRLITWLQSLGRLNEDSDDEDEDEDEEDHSESRAAEVLQNLPLVRGAGAVGEEKRKWRKFQEKRFKLKKRKSKYSAAIKPITQLTTLVFMLAFMLALSLSMGQLEAYDVVRFVVFFLLLRRLMSAFSKIVQVPQDWSDYTRDIDKYLSLMDRADKGIVKSGDFTLDPLTQPLEIRRLNFSYGDLAVFENLSITFPLNRCTAVVGLSGSGKSTLLKLLTRQYEFATGKIELNGLDIRTYTVESLSNEIVHSGSEPAFFSNSIEYNLCYGIEGVESQEIFAALELSHSADFISTLEFGLQTTMGLDEQLLSRGQLQRLGIARLLLQRHASLFLLDEATSALDEATEKSILQLMESLPNTTIIFVTHRTAAIDPEMNVVVFDQGRVVEQGMRKHLEADSGSYFNKLRHSYPDVSSIESAKHGASGNL